jgi:hypothetical protein
VILTHPAAHEEALSQLRASSRDISIFDSRESLTGRPSIGSILLLYANTASRNSRDLGIPTSWLWLSLHIYLASTTLL